MIATKMNIRTMAALLAIAIIGCSEKSNTDRAESPIQTLSSDSQNNSSTSPSSSTIDDVAEAISPVEAISPQEESLNKLITSDIQRLQDAIYSGDVDTIIELTPAETLEDMGGEDEARRSLAIASGQMQSIGMRLEELSFPSLPTYPDGIDGKYVVVHYATIVSAGDKEIETKSYFIGVRKSSEERWKYVDGNKAVQAGINDRFPDFPNDVKFPEHSQSIR